MVQVARVVTESRWGGGDGLRWCCKECVRVAGRKADVREGRQTVGAKAADGDQSAQSAASAQRASQPGGRGRYVCRYGLKSTSYRHLWRRRSDGANLHCTAGTLDKLQVPPTGMKRRRPQEVALQRPYGSSHVLINHHKSPMISSGLER